MPSVLADRYELRARIGSGGMATVWRGFDRTLGREVAIKVLSETLATDDKFRHRFEREARHIASLSHPNIVVVHDFGVDGDRAFIVMELVTGKCLRQLLAESAPLAPQTAADLAADILAGLDHAHEAGILHRDIKPGNVLITDSGVAKLADFGIAKSSDETVDLTDTGNIVGTISYASPEQLSGSPVGRPSDIYSLGCVLYECLAGRPPFVADNIAALVSQQQFARPEPLPDLSNEAPAQLDNTIMRALEKDPGRRYNTADAMRAAMGGSAAKVFATPPTSRLSIRSSPTERPHRGNSGSLGGRGNHLSSRRMFIAALVGVLIVVVAVATLALTLLRGSSPTVVVVNPVLPAQKQTITISGSGFGHHAAFNGVLPCIEFIDKTAGWSAGHAVPVGMGPGAGGACGLRQSDDDDAKDPVHVHVTQWTNTKIVISELTGAYGTVYEGKHCVLVPGDIVSVRVWNAESGAGPGGSSTAVVY